MAEIFEAGFFNILDKATDTYHPMLAIKGDKGDPGPVASEETIRRVTSEEVAKVVAEAPEDFDTLKEISDWIATHQDDASAMNTAILQNANDIATNASNIATNTADIATNTADIATNTSAIATNTDDIANLKQIISGTLVAGQTTLELTSDRITSASIIDPYFYVADGTAVEPISYATIKVENGKVTMTFDALSYNLNVGIRVI